MTMAYAAAGAWAGSVPLALPRCEGNKPHSSCYIFLWSIFSSSENALVVAAAARVGFLPCPMAVRTLYFLSYLYLWDTFRVCQNITAIMPWKIRWANESVGVTVRVRVRVSCCHATCHMPPQWHANCRRLHSTRYDCHLRPSHSSPN